MAATAAGRLGRGFRRPTSRRWSTRSARSTNPYHATWNKGGEAFAKSVGADYVTLVTEGNSEKGIADIKAILAKTGGNCVINVDPNDSPDARPIVEACQGGRRLRRHPVEQARRPASLGLRPELRRAHLLQRRALRQGDGRGADQGDGRQGRHRGAGRHPVERAGDRAQGRASMQALDANPDVKLLDFQVANWSATEALEKTNAWLTQFGDEITGIWAANDDMALAARRGAARRRSCRQGAGDRHRRHPARGRGDPEAARWPAPSPGIPSGRAAWASRSATTPRPASSIRRRSRRSTASSTARACIITERERQANITTPTSRAEPKLDWNDIWGRVNGPDPVRLTPRTRRPTDARPHGVRSRRGRSGGRSHDGRQRIRRARRERRMPRSPPGRRWSSSWCSAPHRVDQPELPQPSATSCASPGGGDPAGARARRHLHHPDGLDRPLGRGRADARRGHPLDARPQRRQRQRSRPAGQSPIVLAVGAGMGFINGVDPRQAAGSRPSWRRSACGSSASASPTRSSAAWPCASTTR